MLMAYTWWQVMLAGAAGPFMIELVKLGTAKNKKRAIQRWKDPGYWLVASALFLLGALVALIHGVDPGGVPVLRAAHLGAAAPLLVNAWASTLPTETTRKHLLPQVGDHDDPGRQAPKNNATVRRLIDCLRWESAK